MGIDITGASSRDEPRVRRWCEEALSALGLPPDLQVHVSGFGFGRAPGGREASGGPYGVWLHQSLLWGNDLRLGWIVYEEVAHVALERMGVPHRDPDSEEAFWQELFGAWVQYRALVASGRIPESRLTTQPIESGAPHYSLGKHVGAALAGSEANRRHLDEWDRSGIAHRKRRLVDVGLALEPPLSAEAVANAYRST